MHLVGSSILGSMEMAKGCVYLVSSLSPIPEHSRALAPAHLRCPVHIASFQTKFITTVRSQNSSVTLPEKKRKRIVIEAKCSVLVEEQMDAPVVGST